MIAVGDFARDAATSSLALRFVSITGRAGHQAVGCCQLPLLFSRKGAVS